MSKFLSFLFILVLLFPIRAQTPFLDARLQPGPYAVGYRSFHEYDTTRTRIYSVGVAGDTLPGPAHQPIQISIWYPAVANPDLAPMPFRRYMERMATEYDFAYQGDPLQQPFVRARLFQDPFFNSEQVAMALQAQSGALENAQPQSGPFPVLVYSPGAFGPGFENSVMFEYLASQGFIVAAHASPQDIQLAAMKGNTSPEHYERGTRNLEFLINFIKGFPAADPERLGLMGFSAGAVAAVNVQMKNRQVKAVVVLDGAIVYSALEKRLPSLNINQLQTPYAFCSTRIKNRQLTKLVYDLLSRQDAYLLQFNPFGHVFFGSSWILLTNHQGRDSNSVGGTQQEINTGYAFLSEYVLHFFRGYLQGQPKALAVLRTLHLSEKAPEGLLAAEWKQGKE